MNETILFDLTDILIAVITALLIFVWRRWVRPWLEAHELMDEAAIVVNAVEALMGRGNGTEKWKLAVQKMQAYGFDVNTDIVLDAIRAAWKDLDTTQRMTGEKTEPPEPKNE